MPSAQKIKAVVSTLRPHYWMRNVLIFIGSVAAWFFLHHEITPSIVNRLALALALSCLVSAVNYIINEILDAPFDARHPIKKFRAIPQGLVSIPWLLFLAALLLVISFGAAWAFINPFTAFTFLVFFGAGIIYNVPPFRLKDIPFLDVISESFNNPIRFLIGWYAYGATLFPPVWVLICFWAFGAMLMSARRLGEKNILMEHDAQGYRPTFEVYTSQSLKIQYTVYALISAALFLLLSLEYHPLLAWFLPVLGLFMVWVLRMSTYMVPGGIKGDSHYYTRFLPFTVFMLVLFFVLLCN